MRQFVVKDFHYADTKFSSEKGIVEGYFSSFGTVDMDGDIIEAGAFKKTLKENGPSSKKDRIQFLFQHDRNEVIGKILELEEDSFGLRFAAKIADTRRGRDVKELYKINALREHSIGFELIRSKKGDEGTQLIQEVKLWEGSVVTWGANANTPITAIKNLNLSPEMIDLLGNKQLEHIFKQLIKLSGSSPQAGKASLSPADQAAPDEATLQQLSTPKEDEYAYEQVFEYLKSRLDLEQKI